MSTVIERNRIALHLPGQRMPVGDVVMTEVPKAGQSFGTDKLSFVALATMRSTDPRFAYRVWVAQIDKPEDGPAAFAEWQKRIAASAAKT